MLNPRQALEAEAAKFRAWADTQPIATRSGEWETNYLGWSEVYSAFEAYVQTTGNQDWDAAITVELLYLIARDNEMQTLIEEIAKRPEDVLYLAKNAVSYPDYHAKWQLAVELGELDAYKDAALKLLLLFAYDEDMYVRRRAMISLANLGSAQVEELAANAWKHGDENMAPQANMNECQRCIRSGKLARRNSTPI